MDRLKISGALVAIFLFVSFSVSAQEGINFNLTENWAETTAKAAKENKLIFIDGYTTWCAPCKWMDKNVFVDPSVAEFYNDKFINVKIDMEKGEGIELRKKYNVGSFPTFLFVNDKGEVIHRTGSKMSIEEFLGEGRTAADPKRNISYLNKKYEEGQKDIPFVLDFHLAVLRSDRSMADKLGRDIISRISEQELNSELGWNVIKALARSENDKLGKHFLVNQEAYAVWGSAEERNKVEERIMTSSMYGFIASKDEAAFMKKLPYFKNSTYASTRQQGVMLEADFYLEIGKAKEYKILTNAALKGELKNEAEKLSFLARRANYKGVDNPIIMKQAYLMAKRATVLDPEEYSVQSTFANVCLTLKKKKEALKAAKASRYLAEAETSKIQNIADELIKKIEAL